MMTLLLALAAPVAFAQAPPLCDGICFDPPGELFSTNRTRATIASAEHTFRVVVAKDVGESAGAWSSPAEAKLEQTWSAWTKKRAFDPAEDVLIVLAMNTRELRVKTGSRWDAELDLQREHLLPFIDRSFLPFAKRGDLDGGLTRLIADVDHEINQRVADQARTAARTELLRSVPPTPGLHLSPRTLKLELPLTEARLREQPAVVLVFDQASGAQGGYYRSAAYELASYARRVWGDGFHPKDTPVIVVTLDEGQSAVSLLNTANGALPPRTLGADVDAGIVAALDLAAAELAAKEEAARAAEARADQLAEQERQAKLDRAEALVRQQRLEKLRFAALLLFLPFVVFLLWLKNAVARRLAFGRELNERATALAEARATATDALVPPPREQLLPLQLKGASTTALVAQAQADTARLWASLDALDAQLVALRAQSPRLLLTTRRLYELTEVASAPVTLSDGVQVGPDAFLAECTADLAQTRAAWERVRAILAVSERSAAEDLPDEGLKRLRTTLAAAGLSDAWLRTHPLVPSAAVAWARLDGRRWSDPARYLDELEAAHREQAELERIVAEVVGWKQATTEAHARLRASALTDLHTCFADPGLDPDTQAQALDRVLHAFEAALASGKDLVGVRDEGQDFVVGADVLIAKRERVRQAVRHGAQAIDQASAAVDACRAARLEQLAKLQALLTTNTPEALSDASRELGEADEDLEHAAYALDLATEHWAANQHLEAVQAANFVKKQVTAANIDLTELTQMLTEVADAKQRAEALWKGLQAHRLRCADEIEQLEVHGLGLDLDAGDALLNDARARWTDGRTDWRARLADVERVTGAWSASVNAGRARKVAHEEELARERRAREAAHEAAERSYSSSSDSSSDSSYSSSRSSGSSYSSESRSAGGSYSSGGRSAGGSYSSGGRSAGRHW